MRGLAFMAACSVPLATSAAMAADVGTGTLRELHAVAACVVEQKPALVADLLSTLPGSDREARAADRLAAVYTACSDNKFKLAISKYSQGLYNGRSSLAAAAALAAMDRRTIDPSRIRDVQVWYANTVVGRAPGNDYSAAALAAQEFGTCVVKAAPDSAVQLLRFKAGSAEERQPLSAIMSVLPGCIFSGKPVSMKRDQIRLMIAEPLYHAIVAGPLAGRRS